MELSRNQFTAPMELHGARLADYAVARIDEFFDLDASTTEAEKLHEGLVWGVEHGMMTEEEAQACEQAYHDHLRTDLPPTVG
jgi:hypothetical protein